MSDSEEEHRVGLVEPISRSALTGADGVTFCVSDRLNRDDALLDQPEDAFAPDDLIKHCNLDVLDIHEGSLGDTPFESIKEKMVKVNNTGTVMKRIKRHGVGDVVEPNSIVTIHYNGYVEFKEVPFDSSSLRGKAETFTLGQGFLPGLDIAVSSMRKRERAEFLLHPSVAYGRIGCPPRIPANAEVLFDIELINARTGVEVEVEEAVSREEKTSWENVHKVVRSLVSASIESYKNNQMKESKIKLEKAKRYLVECHLKNEEEEDEQKRVLLKVCTNLSMVYNKLADHPSNAPNVIINCKEGLAIDPQKHKLHLQWGLALIKLGEYAKAKEHLLRAKRAFPNDPEVLCAFETLEIKLQREKAAEGDMWKRAFKQTGAENNKEDDCKVPLEEDEYSKMISDFFSDQTQEKLVLPGGVSNTEKVKIFELADRLGLVRELKENRIVIKKSK